VRKLVIKDTDDCDSDLLRYTQTLIDKINEIIWVINGGGE